MKSGLPSVFTKLIEGEYAKRKHVLDLPNAKQVLNIKRNIKGGAKKNTRSSRGKFT